MAQLSRSNQEGLRGPLLLATIFPFWRRIYLHVGSVGPIGVSRLFGIYPITDRAALLRFDTGAPQKEKAPLRTRGFYSKKRNLIAPDIR